MSPRTVLIVDDEPSTRFAVQDFLESKGFTVEAAETCEAARAAFNSVGPDLAVLDYSLPDGTALDLLPTLREIDPTLPVVILTGHGTIDLAVRALQEGADHFLTKPVELPTLAALLTRLLEQRRNRQRQLAQRSKEERGRTDPFLGTSAAIRRLAREAERFLPSDSPVLIHGETGSGKGVLAAWLHRNGPRADEAFVDLNCASLSRDLLESELFGHEKGAFTGATARKPGLFEAAHRGTFFLDEIGDLDPNVQPRLLKVLEERRFRRVGDIRDRSVDVRLIAASHQELPGLVEQGRFRQDLYFRVNTIPLFVPPLRERLEDIEVLARQLLRDLTAELGRGPLSLAPATVAALESYTWPGNIRELRNVLERAALLCEGEELEPSDLEFQASGTPKVPRSNLTLAEVEHQHIENVLREERGRVELAAERLGIPRSTLYAKIRRLGLEVPRT